ncbi:hypothetical protein V6N11_002642 [Hibiscus sabdariffa]|uniref:Shugoshin C-terminal domain-containing protein n=1 Tax=Hibiscus sabdariffa TaxID=183260 RepID=A0ABR2SBA1_9ROSI
MGGETMAKRSSLGSLMRTRLSDITNTISQPKPLNQEEKPQQISPHSEDYINQLIQEKMSLMKITEERDKIIALSGAEMLNLRSCLQKLQLQNWNLAQTNNQLLAELYLGRDKVKALQHELVCKDALLKAKNLEKKGKAGINCQNTSPHGEQATEECMSKVNNHDKRRSRNTRHNARSQSTGPSTTTRRGGNKDKGESKRRCLRRQSRRVKSQEAEDLIEIDDLDFVPAHLLESPRHESPLLSSFAMEMEETCSPKAEKRCSMGRPIPLRKTVEKVQSYKEVSLNIRIRRKE